MNKVFISYSHKDKKWLERLQVHLAPLIRNGTIDCWDDTHINPGAKWLDEIEEALAAATVAILFVSADYWRPSLSSKTSFLRCLLQPAL